MPWLYLLIAGLMEIGWVISLKETNGFTRIVPLIFYAVFGFCSAFCLSQAMKNMSMATAYSSWTGIAVIGSTLAGVYFFKEPGSAWKAACIVLIIIGIVGLKLDAQDLP